MDLIDKESLVYGQIEILSSKDQEGLWKLAQEGDLEARNKLIIHNMPFLIKITTEHWSKHPQRFKHMEFDDLVQIAVFGIEHAIRKFNISKMKTKDSFRPLFLTCCRLWVHHYLDDWSNQCKAFRVPRSTQYMYDKGLLDKPSQATTKRAIAFFQNMKSLPRDFDKPQNDLTPLERMTIIEEASKKVDLDNNIKMSV